MIPNILRETNKNISVVIKSRKRTYYEGQALSLSSVNESGPFDVLPSHANFITTIRDYIKLIIDENNAQDFAIKEGVLRAYEDEVSVYLTVA
ncbi:hypothetical protein HYV31_00305 [candidate division WWE3 bacterium]|nr:hypothetical protein [candidate division WWE3 bacterium]